MTESDKINQVFALLERAKNIEGVGDLRSFHFSWDMAPGIASQGALEMFPNIRVEYWAKPIV
jgi:hypothetical protein